MFSEKGFPMKSIQKSTVGAVAVTVLFVLGGCSGMSQREQNTAVGAGAGAVAGAVLTGGSPIGTVGGAAVGGLIGNQVGR
jgi:osmotically inducible lipoprotein OsmB